MGRVESELIQKLTLSSSSSLPVGFERLTNPEFNEYLVTRLFIKGLKVQTGRDLRGLIHYEKQCGHDCEGIESGKRVIIELTQISPYKLSERKKPKEYLLWEAVKNKLEKYYAKGEKNNFLLPVYNVIPIKSFGNFVSYLNFTEEPMVVLAKENIKKAPYNPFNEIWYTSLKWGRVVALDSIHQIA